MCLTDFQEFKQIPKSNPLIGYRKWRNLIKDSTDLKSESQNYIWTPKIISHKVTDVNSGIYAYNNYNYYYYYNNYSYSYNNNYNNNYYYYNNNYYLLGIIHQYGRVAIHKYGQRSQYAKIDTLFSIRETDVKEPQSFIDWIKIFNQRIMDIATKYKVSNVITWQDFTEKNNK